MDRSIMCNTKKDQGYGEKAELAGAMFKGRGEMDVIEIVPIS